MRGRLAGLRGVPKGVQRRVAQVRRYMELSLETYELHVEALREKDQGKFDKATAKMDEVNAAAAELNRKP